jgi:hypothetical protein
MIESEPTQKFDPPVPLPPPPVLMLSVVLIVLPAPVLFDGVTEYDVFAAGAETLTEHAVDEMPLVHEQLVNGLPVPHATERLTEVPAVTAVDCVFGDCEMTQPLGGDPPPPVDPT